MVGVDLRDPDLEIGDGEAPVPVLEGLVKSRDGAVVTHVEDEESGYEHGDQQEGRAADTEADEEALR
ncbi:hypothetical protein GCM10028793_15360 [Nocardiopsis oceani]